MEVEIVGKYFMIGHRKPSFIKKNESIKIKAI